MKHTALKRRTALRSKTPIKASPLLRKAIKRRRKPLTQADRAEYAAGVDVYRDPEGFCRCADCGRGLLDREIQRHHVVLRSAGGKTVRANILPLCPRCHGRRHGEHFPELPGGQPEPQPNSTEVIHSELPATESTPSVKGLG